MSTESEQYQNESQNGHAELSNQEEIVEISVTENNVEHDDDRVEQVQVEDIPPSQEDGDRSRHTSTSSSAVQEEPVCEAAKSPVVESKSIDENEHSSGNQVKKVRPVFQRDFTQQSVVKTEFDKDENDWAKKNMGKSSLAKSLIAKFSSGMVLNEKSGSGNSSYKSDYGVGQGKGQIRQDVFH